MFTKIKQLFSKAPAPAPAHDRVQVVDHEGNTLVVKFVMNPYYNLPDLEFYYPWDTKASPWSVGKVTDEQMIDLLNQSRRYFGYKDLDPADWSKYS